MSGERRVKYAGYTVTDSYRCLENLDHTSTELYLVYCGWEQNHPNDLFGPVTRRNHVLHFIFGGKGRFSMGDRSWDLGRGDIFYIPPGEKCVYVADADDPWSYVWIGYNGVRAEEFTNYTGLTAQKPVGKCQDPDMICKKVEEMLAAHSMSVPDVLLRFARMMEIFSILVRDNEILASSHAEDPDFVRLALDYITENFNRNIRINDLAVHLNVSRSYLSSSFKKAVGCSPQTFILNLRMERAKSLLRTTTLPINVISDSVGYQDQLAFSKVFKNYFGISPRDFRKNPVELRFFENKGECENSQL